MRIIKFGFHLLVFLLYLLTSSIAAPLLLEDKSEKLAEQMTSKKKKGFLSLLLRRVHALMFVWFSFPYINFFHHEKLCN